MQTNCSQFHIHECMCPFTIASLQVPNIYVQKSQLYTCSLYTMQCLIFCHCYMYVLQLQQLSIELLLKLCDFCCFLFNFTSQTVWLCYAGHTVTVRPRRIDLGNVSRRRQVDPGTGFFGVCRPGHTGQLERIQAVQLGDVSRRLKRSINCYRKYAWTVVEEL